MKHRNLCINGSSVVFGLMFIGSVFFGRVWCAAFCPVAGLQECAFLITDREPKQGWQNRVKYGIWVIWVAAVAACWILGRGDFKISFFYATDHGISISSIYHYIIYYGIILLESRTAHRYYLLTVRLTCKFSRASFPCGCVQFAAAALYRRNQIR